MYMKAWEHILGCLEECSLEFFLGLNMNQRTFVCSPNPGQQGHFASQGSITSERERGPKGLVHFASGWPRDSSTGASRELRVSRFGFAHHVLGETMGNMLRRGRCKKGKTCENWSRTLKVDVGCNQPQNPSKKSSPKRYQFGCFWPAIAGSAHRSDVSLSLGGFETSRPVEGRGGPGAITTGALCEE